MSGCHYVEGVLGLYLDGITTDEEIAPLSDEVCDFIHAYKNTFA